MKIFQILLLVLGVFAALSSGATLVVRLTLKNGVTVKATTSNDDEKGVTTVKYRSDIKSAHMGYFNDADYPNVEVNKVVMRWNGWNSGCVYRQAFRVMCTSNCEYEWGKTLRANIVFSRCANPYPGGGTFRRYFGFVRSYKCYDSYNNLLAQPAVNGFSAPVSTNGAAVSATVKFKYTAVVSSGDECKVNSCKAMIGPTSGASVSYSATYTCAQTVGSGSSGKTSTVISVAPNSASVAYYSYWITVGSKKDGFDSVKTSSKGKMCVKAYPGLPTSLKSGFLGSFTKSTGQRVSLSWTGVTYWGWPCNAAYTAGSRKYVAKLGSSTATVDGSSATLALPALNVGYTTFTWTVYASVDGLYNPSIPKATVSVCLIGNPTAPTANSPSGTSSEESKVTFSWSGGSFGQTCGMATGGYKLTINGGKTYTTTTNSTSATVDISNFQTSGTISWTVTIIGAGGLSAVSTAKTFKLCNLTVSKPTGFALTSAPSVVCESGSNFGVDFKWTAPASWGGTCKSNKDINIFVNSTAKWTVPGTSYSSTLPCKHGKTTFSANAYNGVKTSSTTDQINVNVCELKHCAALTGMFTSTAVTGGIIKGRSVALTWPKETSWGNDCSSAARYYYVSVTDPVTGKATELRVGEDTTTVEYRIANKGEHTWTVVAKTGSRTSPVSAKQTFTACEMQGLGEISDMDAQLDGSKVTFSWANPEDLTGKIKQCNVTIAYTTRILAKPFNSNQAWTDLTPNGLNTPTTTTTTYTFPNTDQSWVWKVVIENKEGIPAVESYEMFIPFAEQCSQLLPSWDGNPHIKPQAGATLQSPITFEWEKASFGPLCDSESTVFSYTVFAGSASKTTLFTETATALDVGGGQYNWYVQANRNEGSTKSVGRALCVVDPVPSGVVFDYTATLNTPFDLQWDAAAWQYTCNLTKDVTILFENDMFHKEIVVPDADEAKLAVDETEITTGTYDVSVTYTLKNPDGSTFSTRTGSVKEVRVCNPPPVENVAINEPVMRDYVLCSTKTMRVAWDHNVDDNCLTNKTVTYTLTLTNTDTNVQTVRVTDKKNVMFEVEEYGNYTVAVVASNNYKESGHIEREFHCCTPSIAPINIVYPAAESVLTNLNDVTLEWGKVEYINCGYQETLVLYYSREGSAEVSVELNPGATNFTITSLTAYAPYTWRLVAGLTDSGIDNVVAESTFTPCKTTAPEAVELKTPQDGTVYSSNGDVTFMWNFTKPGETCGNELIGHYTVYMFQEGNTNELEPLVVVSGIENYTCSGFDDGVSYCWNLTAQNAWHEEAVSSATACFEFCLEQEPNMPALYSPIDNQYMKTKDENFAFRINYDMQPFGKSCRTEEESGSEYFILEVQNLRSQSTEVVFTSVLGRNNLTEHFDNTTDEPWTYSFPASGLKHGIYTWAVTSVHPRLGKSTSERWTMSVCDDPETVNWWTSLDGNTNETNTDTPAETELGGASGEETEVATEEDEKDVVPFEVTVFYEAPRDWGFPCTTDTQTTQDNRLYIELYKMVTVERVSTRQDPEEGDEEEDDTSSDTEEPTVVLEEMLVQNIPLLLSNDQFVLGPDYLNETDTTYSIAVVASNGGSAISESKVTFKTQSMWCGAVLKCSTHGSCNENERVCACDDGWEGTLCDSQTAAVKNNTSAVVGGVVGGIVLLLIIAAIVLYIVSRRYGNVLDAIMSGPKMSHRFIPLGNDDDEEIVPSVVQFIKKDRPLFEAAVKSFMSIDPAALNFDETVAAIVYCYADSKHSEQLILRLVMLEIQSHVESRSNRPIMFNNCVATTAFKVWARMIGLKYLFATFADMFKRFRREAILNEQNEIDDMTNFELNPEKDAENDVAGTAYASSLALTLLFDDVLHMIDKKARRMPVEMLRLWNDLWVSVSEATDAQSADTIFRETVGGLFFHRFLIYGLTDPYGYGILADYPDQNLHSKLKAVSELLGKFAYGMVFGEENRYMMQFNKSLEDNAVRLNNLLGAFAEGALVAHAKSEGIRVPKKKYRQSLGIYHYALTKQGIALE